MQPLPLFGTYRYRVEAISPVSIHGDLYYDLQIATEAPEDFIRVVRVPSHLCPRPPEHGDLVSLTFLMQQVTELKIEA